ncbi:hypothetical protein T06_16251 [Trichinella sp. T6]|nr:hypothetical protein T06_16251 [Trichinella sp. T6]
MLPLGPTYVPLRSHCLLIGRWPRNYIGPSSLCRIGLVPISPLTPHTFSQ